MSGDAVKIGVIGGSGLYHMPQITDIEERHIETPFGMPSDTVVIGRVNGMRVAFLPRHGRGHVFSPSEVPYRANIYALKSLGVEWVISISACGSLREDFAPGHIVVPDQLVDKTKDKRDRTFFEGGIVAHVSVAEPFCMDLSKIVARSVREAGGVVHEGGVFVTIEGPRFSTKGESNFYRTMGMSLVGMTTSPEAFLAREAEMCYAVMAHVTDYDVWHESEKPVTVDMVVQTLNANLEIAQKALVLIVERLSTHVPTCDHRSALQQAFITDRRKITPEVLARLRPIIGKYFA